jgi:hypothetical protein
MDSVFFQKKFERFLARSKFDFVFHNVFIYTKESDIFACKDGLVYEYEFKVGVSDFRKDYKKKRHTDGNTPNYFYYVVSSEDIIKGEYLEYAGIYVHSFQKDGHSKFKLIKEAALLSNNKITNQTLYSLIKKIYNGKKVHRQH